MTIALLAPDGAGKTTLACALARGLPVPVRIIHLGLYRSNPRRWHVPGLGLTTRVLALWTSWARGQMERFRGRVVIFDRYPYDAALPSRRPLSYRGRIRRWTLSHACPAPDLVVILDAPGDVLHARKGEQTPEILERERRAYLEMARRLPAPVAIVDASDSVDVVRREVTRAIWREHPRRGQPRAASSDLPHDETLDETEGSSQCAS